MTESAVDRSQFQEGMLVLGSDGERVGHVREVGDAALVVDRAAQPAIHVPFSFIRYTSGNGVVLTIAANKAGEMHWETSAR